MSLEVQPNASAAAVSDGGQPTAAPSGQGSAAANASTDRPGTAPPVSREHLNAAVDQLNRQAQEIRRSLQFVVDHASGEVVVKVVDTDTNKVISQIPPQDILALREHLKKMSGLLLHAHA